MPWPPFWVRYPLRQNLEKSMFFAISTSLKIIKHTFKIPSNPYKIRLQSNLLKIFKKSIQIIQNKTPTPTPFHPTKIKHFTQSDHPKITISPNPLKFTSQIQTSHTHLRPKFGIKRIFISSTNPITNRVITIHRGHFISWQNTYSIYHYRQNTQNENFSPI